MSDATVTTDKKKPRIRSPKACNHCRQRKVKCNGNKPCQNCIKYQITCQYSESPVKKPRKRRTARKIREELEAKKQALTSSINGSIATNPIVGTGVSNDNSSDTIRKMEARLCYLEKNVLVLFTKIEDFLTTANEKLDRIDGTSHSIDDGSSVYSSEADQENTTSNNGDVNASEDSFSVALQRYDTNSSTASSISSLKTDLFNVSSMIGDFHQDQNKDSSANVAPPSLTTDSSFSSPVSDPNILYMPSIDMFPDTADNNLFNNSTSSTSYSNIQSPSDEAQYSNLANNAAFAPGSFNPELSKASATSLFENGARSACHKSQGLNGEFTKLINIPNLLMSKGLDNFLSDDNLNTVPNSQFLM